MDWVYIERSMTDAVGAMELVTSRMQRSWADVARGGEGGGEAITAPAKVEVQAETVVTIEREAEVIDSDWVVVGGVKAKK